MRCSRRAATRSAARFASAPRAITSAAWALLGRGEESALCASASGEQRTACTIAAAALEGELLLLVGTASQSLESLRLRLMGARAAAGGQLLLAGAQEGGECPEPRATTLPWARAHSC